MSSEKLTPFQEAIVDFTRELASHAPKMTRSLSDAETQAWIDQRAAAMSVEERAALTRDRLNDLARETAAAYLNGGYYTTVDSMRWASAAHYQWADIQLEAVSELAVREIPPETEGV